RRRGHARVRGSGRRDPGRPPGRPGDRHRRERPGHPGRGQEDARGRGPPRGAQVILVEGTKITAVGAGLAVPPGAQVIDLPNATVLPGMFDCHSHLCTILGKAAGDSPRDVFGALLLTTLTDSTAYRAIQGVVNARAMLEAGFTTVRDVGNAANYADTDLRRAQEQGLIQAPTIVNAGRIITVTAGQSPPRTPAWLQDPKTPDLRHTGVLTPERPGLGN